MDIIISKKTSIHTVTLNNVQVIECRILNGVKYYIFDNVETTDYPVSDTSVFIINTAAPVNVG